MPELRVRSIFLFCRYLADAADSRRRMSQREKYFSFARERKNNENTARPALNLLWLGDKGILFQLRPTKLTQSLRVRDSGMLFNCRN